MQPPALTLRRPRTITLEDLDLPGELPVIRGVDLRLAQRIQLHFVGPDDDVGVFHLADLLHLRVGEGCLRRPATPEEEDFADVAVPQRVERMRGDVGLQELLGCAHQDARHVDRDIADADDGSAFHREIELTILVIGMGVVPGDELRRGVAAGEVLTGDAHLAVGLRAGGENHLVIVAGQIRQRDVPAVLDVAEEAEARVPGDGVVGARDVLDLGVVGRDPVAHEPVRRRQPLEHVDLGDEPWFLEQLFGSVKRGGARTNDGDAERLIGVSCGWHLRKCTSLAESIVVSQQSLVVALIRTDY